MACQVLGGIADTLAQTLTAYRMKQLRDPDGKDNLVSIEIQEMDKRGLFPASELMPLSKKVPPTFDFERLTRFMAYGFIMSPVQYKWYAFLNRSFPLTKQSGIAPALKRVAFDQLMFAPIGTHFQSESYCGRKTKVQAGLACFFTFMTVAEGGGRRAVARKFQDVYLPALKANFMLWPAVQILNFRAIPLPFQIVSSSRSPYLEGFKSLISALLALRFHRRNCLDSVSVTDQLCR